MFQLEDKFQRVYRWLLRFPVPIHRLQLHPQVPMWVSLYCCFTQVAEIHFLPATWSHRCMNQLLWGDVMWKAIGCHSTSSLSGLMNLISNATSSEICSCFLWFNAVSGRNAPRTATRYFCWSRTDRLIETNSAHSPANPPLYSTRWVEKLDRGLSCLNGARRLGARSLTWSWDLIVVLWRSVQVV